MKKRSFILGLVFLMFVSSVVYPNRVKDTEQSWEEEEDRSIICLLYTSDAADE